MKIVLVSLTLIYTLLSAACALALSSYIILIYAGVHVLREARSSWLIAAAVLAQLQRGSVTVWRFLP